MKKHLSITISAMLLIAVATAVFVSCKKDMREVAFSNQISEKTEAQLVYEKIIKFREARESYHANTKTDNGYVSPSEARSILDGAINYEFSDMNRHLEETRFDTIRYAAPAINGEGNVAVNDLIGIYDEFVTNISNESNSVNYFMIFYPTSNTRPADVEIVFTRGVQPPHPELIPQLDYFDEDDNWIWGGGNGNCAHTIFDGDAASKLTEKCQAMLDSQRTRDGIDTLSFNIFPYAVEYETKTYDSLQSIVNGLDYWLFHAENIPSTEVSYYCIYYNYLNLYLRNLYHAIINPNGCYHYSINYHSPIRDILIDDNEKGDNVKNINHSAFLTFYKYAIFD